MSKTFARRLMQLRKKRRLTQRALADRLCCSQSAISKYEIGGDTPGIDFLVNVATYFNVSADWLLGLPEHRCHDSRDHAAKRKLQEARKAAEAMRDSVTDLMDALRDEVKEDIDPSSTLYGPRLYAKVSDPGELSSSTAARIVGYAYGEPWVQQALLMGDLCFDTPEAAKAAWEEGLI